MTAQREKEFWKACSPFGRPAVFDHPEALWKAACEYFVWTEENPLQEEKVFCNGGDVTRVTIDKMRAMTIEGLCAFLGINSRTWRNYRKKTDDFFPIVSMVEAVIWEQKFTGAAAGLLNSNIIARELGLVDKREHTGKVTLEDLLSDLDEGGEGT